MTYAVFSHPSLLPEGEGNFAEPNPVSFARLAPAKTVATVSSPPRCQRGEAAAVAGKIGWNGLLAGAARTQRGFTLLEVLVAFSILALTLGVLIQVFSQAIATTILSGAYSRASVLAEQKLNDVGLDIPLQAGSFSGEPEDGIAWQVTITPYDLGDTGWQAPLQPYVVTATAAWEEGSRSRQVTLSSLRLGEPTDLGLGTSIPENSQRTR